MLNMLDESMFVCECVGGLKLCVTKLSSAIHLGLTRQAFLCGKGTEGTDVHPSKLDPTSGGVDEGTGMILYIMILYMYGL